MGKIILGLDLGTNSVGWALVDAEEKKILGMGSRIIPMSQDILGEFDKGNSISQTAERTKFRGARHLYERHHLRRERLHRVLNVLGFLPEHYANEIDFEKRFGKIFDEKEPKIAWKKNTETEKFEFLFQKSFYEMLEDFKANGQAIKIPYDWTIYYLRKKALTQKLEKEELAWLILNFNQKRGYYQLRGEEEEETPNKLVEFYSLKIVDVIADEEQNKKGETWYSLHLENGWVYRRSSKTSLADWKDKTRDFIVTTDLNDDGSVKTDKEGNEKRNFRAPSEDDWTLLKKKTEADIEHSQKTVGAYIYETLLQKPNQKIRGKLVRTIERKFYKDELISILKKQIELQPELFTDELYNDCVRELYRSNEAHQLTLSKRDFVHLFVDDILFYHRPLKSQKSGIANCPLESRTLKEKNGQPKLDKDGTLLWKIFKAIPKSNPYYQEFRLWQWLYNLKIYTRDDDKDVTVDFITSNEDKVKLFAFLMTKEKVNHKDILQFFIAPKIKEKYPNAKPKALNEEIAKAIAKYRWNYVFDDSKEKEDEKSKSYPCNETGYEIQSRLKNVQNVPDNFLTREIEQELWHILYSVTDKNEFEKALKSFAEKKELDVVSFVDTFKKFRPFKSEYGSYSEKAIKKLLPLMRVGKYWNWETIDSKTKARIEKLQTAEVDESIKEKVRQQVQKEKLDKNEDYQGLPLWLAQYVVYDRHSEAGDIKQWKSVNDLGKYLEEFKQHSLRNPIVEQVVTETLRVVKDIWKHYGNGAENFFNEIHVELGREMKNTAEDRKRITNQVTENENTNLRIKLLLAELKNDSKIENVREYSPTQQEILKIYEEYALLNNEEYDGKDDNGKDKFKTAVIPEDIIKISKTAQPTKAEITRYKLWLEQKYRSPYTGQMIPLSKLFTSAYEIEHVIPQSRYFDDSFNNKVICESAVNKLKGNQLGLEFIKNHYGRKVELGNGTNETVELFSVEAYEKFVKEHYDKNRSKRAKLLMEEIPEKMIARQMNDTRYISKFISSLLSNIVRADKDDDGVNSKSVIPGNGKITSELRQDWGLNDVWNELILPRFKRMNTLTNTENFTSKNKEGHTIANVPLELSKGFQKKRIDHRHHALDALVIACATRDHVNLLNNQSAKSDTKRYDLQYKLRNTEKWKDKDDKERDKFTEFKKPWENFTVDTKNELGKIVISFKQNLRVINKATNKYEKIENGKKIEVEQKGTNWAIRKSLHKATVAGEVKLARIKVPKGKILTATRKAIDTSFDLKTIESITDTGIQKILKNHLKKYEGQKDEKGKDIAPETLAFTPEGIEDMNKNIVFLNDNISHQPIYKVRIFEVGSKFALGGKGNKKTKFVEADKGTNLFFAVYQDKDGKRNFETIPLNIVIERQKQGLSSVPETNEKGNRLLFHLSPNDLVYVPTKEEQENTSSIDFLNLDIVQKKRIYRFISCTGNEGHFVPVNYASPIIKNEMGTNNKSQNTIDNTTQIKAVCLKLKINRVGMAEILTKEKIKEILDGYKQ